LDWERQDVAARKPIPSEDALKVVADGGEDSVGGVAGAALEMTAAEITLGLQVTITVDGGAAAQLTLDDTEDTALLAGDEDPAGGRGIVAAISAAISLVKQRALDLAPRELLGFLDDRSQCVCNGRLPAAYR
jgi:hypothetical protein